MRNGTGSGDGEGEDSLTEVLMVEGRGRTGADEGGSVFLCNIVTIPTATE